MITDWQIHAYVDQQLDSREHSEILCAAARSPELAMRIAELQQLKQLLRHAYEKPPTTAEHGKSAASDIAITL
jgi:anti-sigma factor RsiW